ncbi:MAG: diguanylate cyclase [Dokdonella sp.]
MIALGVLFLAFASVAHAQSVALLVERLGRDVPDSATAQVVAGAYVAEFEPQAYAAIIPSPDHAVWYRVRVASEWAARQSPLFSIADPQGMEVRAFIPPDFIGTTYSIYDTRSRNGFTRHALTFLLPSAFRSTTWIYLRIAPERANPRRLDVTDITDGRVRDLAAGRLDVLFPAVQLATVLVMLAFFLTLRERMYGYFVGHVVCLVLYELYCFGIGYEIPPLDLLAPMRARPLWLFGALATILLFQFSCRFLDLRRSAPRIEWLLDVLCWPLGLLAICAIIPPLSQGWWVEDVLVRIVLVAAPLLIIGGVVAWQDGSRRGGFYLLAWIPGLLLLVARMLQLILHWPLPTWLEFALPGAFAFASVVLSFGLADHTLSMRHERDVAHRLAEHDALTGVLNRRAIVARLRSVFLRARQSKSPLSLLFLDLDHFKQVNDSYGHRAGDQCLRAVIDPISSELRQSDTLGRYGGEEFLVVLPGVDATSAELVAERIRNRVQQMAMLVSGKHIKLTLSVGIATLSVGMNSPEDLIERADVALYRAKAGGRNRVRYAAGAMTPKPMPVPSLGS